MEAESVNTSENDISNDVPSLAADEEASTEEEMRCCKHCNYQAPDWPMFAVHVLKPSHVKKVAEAMKVRVAVDPILTNITCEVCNVTCCGYIPWNAHLMGSRHRRTKEEQQEQMYGKRKNAGGPIRNSQFGNIHNKKPYDLRPNNKQQSRNIQAPQENDFSTYPQPLIGLEYVTETQPNGKIRWYHCSICDVKFDDNLKFPHLVGQKHRLNVLKAKRPEVVKDLDPNSKKRSEVTPILLREATKLEEDEGRQQIKSTFPKTTTVPAGRGIKRGRGGNRGTRGTTRGGRGNRGVSNSRGRGYNIGQYSTQAGHDSHSTYSDSNANNLYGSNLSYNSAYNASFENPDYGRNYQQSYDSGQSHYGGVQPYSAGAHSSHLYSSQSYSNNGQSYSSQNVPSSGLEPKSGISVNLATALGDLTKLVQNEDDASVAFHVSNALTQSLLQFRTTGQE